MSSVNDVGGTEQLSLHQSTPTRMLWKHFSGLAKGRKASSWEKASRRQTPSAQGSQQTGLPASGTKQEEDSSKGGWACKGALHTGGQLCPRSSRIQQERTECVRMWPAVLRLLRQAEGPLLH